MKSAMRHLLPLFLVVGFSTAFFSCAKDDSINSAAVDSDPAAVTDRAPGPSANGQGFLTADYLEGFQTFSFHAKENANGSVSGSWASNWQSTNAGLGGHFSGTIDCIDVLADGKTARMSGVVTHVTGDCCPPFGFIPEVGGAIWFEVQDNGEGANAAGDLFSDWFYLGEFPGTCNDDFGAILLAIENGNIQVKP